MSPLAADLSRAGTAELGTARLRTFLVRKYLKFLGAQVGALFSHFGCASGWMGAEMGVQVVKQARNWVHKLYF